MAYSFVMTGGGTGGHVFPALAVARVLRDRGHQLLFIGTRAGMEARLIPEAGYELEFVRTGALKRAGLRRQLQTAWQLPLGIASASRLLQRFEARAVFSTGGYVAGPVMIASLLRRVPLVIMEPNAVPGFANRRVAGRVYRALIGFESTRKWFPAEKSEVTGLPVRPEFFDVQPKRTGPFTVLITGGSRGAHTLNRASREAWPLLRESGAPVRIVHQTGAPEHEELAREFATAGVEGEVVPFIREMPEAFAQADLVVSRAGAGAVNEIAAAGMPSVFVPLPFAADDHQRRNAEAFVQAGAARLVLDAEMNGRRLFREIEDLRRNTGALEQMRARVRQFARPGAAERAADVLEEAARRKAS
ncbi:MAG TPA: undecaprenyldiphospho-muramoylpentapeptide beta-N-acetylglucosaminyltransferase [Bryobacteraceae bacterium]|jgi:UDP-N-acetylglucosamine--N-acetylmuramyl-(pentapeptide) pyrophosphoryl-undecaprenol N-acetylglucosamine transferase|nr:undecaprenyldiphospho-muramoylpentapeptide beta-N-acetylglucosaminyltransferase [Bryobacteraceae bacterium]